MNIVNGEMVLTPYGYNKDQWEKLVSEVEQKIIKDAR